MLVKFTTSIIVRQENDHDPKVFESPCKIDSIHQNDSIVANRARAVATIKEVTLSCESFKPVQGINTVK